MACLSHFTKCFCCNKLSTKSMWKANVVLETKCLKSTKTYNRLYTFFTKPVFQIQCRNVGLQKSSNTIIRYNNVSKIFSSSSQGGTHKFHPNQESRRQKLLLLTYLSGFIGTCLLGAVGFRQYSAFVRRAQGIEDLRVREYGRRPRLFRYRGYVLPEFAINDLKAIHTFDIRDDDIWVVSFPKAGTTWLQEIVYLIVNDANFEAASQATIDERFPYFEFVYPGKKAISQMPSPRLIKSHLPLSLLPNQITQKKPKIIYIARNPKDTVVSYYSFLAKFLTDIDISFSGTFEDFCQLFVEDLVYCGPWWKHVKEAWDRRDDENILVLFYEDLQSLKHCSFDSMKNNKSVNFDWLKDGLIKKKYFLNNLLPDINKKVLL
ncbi:unnamed protein product [Candidula unifasciata]|uniref:Sulfotransferase domain-containing protein n=1 Tax=Candidula unifasciata TaxID=100452 RepID=A0A8S4A0E8_9EUPU|nr:unnamed protein product [Candidula unifasciata]